MMRAMMIAAAFGVTLAACGGRDVYIDWPDAAMSGTGTASDGGVVVNNTADAGVTPGSGMVRVSLEVPTGEALDQPRICGSFSGAGWQCQIVTPGGASGRLLSADFSFTKEVHVFNACFRTCDDRVLGHWALHKANGQQVVLAQATVVVGSLAVSLSTVDNGLNSYNWKADLRTF